MAKRCSLMFFMKGDLELTVYEEDEEIKKDILK